ncbi:hypothetical protein BN7_6439 [Wickerhamomyces ciferrii]|uniref:Uncharacterized protein n=1 Tax=Wickerhamomyces ciferrii (strain ATCC 14091 / BCRC 22168 / CBS 111 / JCM 3599 / NBRC 0793 / NRRL Y-1031 F-60-10) TaxID=1206466 RepID=K0L097_WICCF|nr:uncharacterized protein BN7_6439 [Wickerhamomyces ciferrii]CCH46838.1 hypothetical protein BN7_6439 [Wickerhamomyces ciferrii]
MLRFNRFSLRSGALATRQIRTFSQYKPLRSGDKHSEHGHEHEHDHDHHDHGEEVITEAEGISNGPYTFAFGVGAVLFTGYYVFNEKFKSQSGYSLTSNVLQPVTSEKEIIDSNKVHEDGVKKLVAEKEALTLPPPEKLFMDYNSVRGVPRGSPTNYIPGLSIDVDNIAPRRKPKSIFD